MTTVAGDLRVPLGKTPQKCSCYLCDLVERLSRCCTRIVARHDASLFIFLRHMVLLATRTCRMSPFHAHIPRPSLFVDTQPFLPITCVPITCVCARARAFVAFEAIRLIGVKSVLVHTQKLWANYQVCHPTPSLPPSFSPSPAPSFPAISPLSTRHSSSTKVSIPHPSQHTPPIVFSLALSNACTPVRKHDTHTHTNTHTHTH